MSKEIDIQYRPKTYFRPKELERHLLSKVKGAVLRKKLKALFDEGRHAEVAQLVDDVAFSASDRKALESFHPMFMGGNYHSGYIAYYVASIGAGKWLRDGVERSAALDDVTQEDVDEGRLNDDQIEAMWGMSLEEAQSSEYRQISAACFGASDDLSAKEMAEILYRAVCEGGGKEISESDDVEGLLQL